MSNRKVIVIENGTNHFSPLNQYLVLHNIDYQLYNHFSEYKDAELKDNHTLIASTTDIITHFNTDLSDYCDYKRRLYNCTYLIAYEHSNCIDSLKEAFAHGADDYVTLPAHPELLCMKLRIQHERLNYLESLYASEQGTIVYNNMSIDPFSKQIYLNGKILDLTHSEFNILYTLAKAPSEVFSMEYLFHLITGQKSLGDYNALMTHVSRLRKKLALVDPTNQYIVTVRNKGYKFNVMKASNSKPFD